MHYISRTALFWLHPLSYRGRESRHQSIVCGRVLFPMCPHSQAVLESLYIIFLFYCNIQWSNSVQLIEFPSITWETGHSRKVCSIHSLLVSVSTSAHCTQKQLYAGMNIGNEFMSYTSLIVKYVQSADILFNFWCFCCNKYCTYIVWSQWSHIKAENLFFFFFTF